MRTTLAPGVVELVADGQGVLVGVAGGVGVVGGVVSVAEAGEGGGFLVVVAEVAELVEGVVVAGGGLGVVAEVVVGVAEAVPCVGAAAASEASSPHGCRPRRAGVGERGPRSG